MIRRTLFLGLMGLAWVLIFQLERFIFYSYQYIENSRAPFRLFVESAMHGLRMDISFSAYLIMLPSLLMGFTARTWEWYRRFLMVYYGLVTFIVSLIVTADLEVFRSWGFRMDYTPLRYLSHPREAMASMSSSPFLLLLSIFVFTICVIGFFYTKLITSLLRNLESKETVPTFLFFTFFSALLIIPVRGGLQLAPMNQSAVYYSSDNFANQLAVNAPWNFFSSLVNNTGRQDNPFIFMSAQEADSLVESLHLTTNEVDLRINQHDTLNVIVIIWESFTAKVVSSLGGTPNITPEFAALSKEGLLFTNLYASGDRSDKGLISLLSGYPAQPITSIITIPSKTATLPSLPKAFRSHGYSTSFYYGGETEFANIKSYLLQQGFDRIVDKKAFKASDMNSKWGAHDHVVLNRLLEDLDNQSSPFFTTLFTLSSHEPFEVPMKSVISGNDVEQKFLNSHRYTDASLGAFIRQAKTKPWWKNTLVIIVSDHGHPLPRLLDDKPSEFHIPMLWLGGALISKGEICNELGSQIDLASTLLGQLHYPAEEFRWSNNLFKKGRTPFAFYSFNNGFGFIKSDGLLVYDNIGRIEIERKGLIGEREKLLGQAYQQTLFSDFLKR